MGKKEEERRRQILWAAIACVSEMGIEGATMKSIAERAGVSTGMITYYFKDKNDLVKNALALGHRMLGETMGAPADGRGPSLLRAMFEANLVRRYPDVPPLSFWTEYWAHASRNPDLQEFRASRLARFRRNVASSVESAMESGQFRHDLDPYLIADLFLALMDGLQLKLAIESANLTPERAMDVLQAVLGLLGNDVGPGNPAGSKVQSKSGR